MSITVAVPERVGDDLTIAYTIDLGTTYVTFADVVDATGFKITCAKITQDKLGASAKRSQSGKPDYGDMGITILYNKTIVALIKGWQDSKLTLGFKVSVAEATGTATVALFNGWIKEFDPFGTVKEDDRLESKIQVQITDVATITPGT